MSYFIVITNNNDKPYEFIMVNGHIKQWQRQDEALDEYKRAIEKYGSDHTLLLENIFVHVTTDVSIRNKDGSYG